MSLKKLHFNLLDVFASWILLIVDYYGFLVKC